MKKSFYFLLAIPLLVSCQTAPLVKTAIHSQTSNAICRQELSTLDETEPLSVLSTVTFLYQKGCYRETIYLGRQAQRLYQDKEYSLTAELTSVFIPEGRNTAYVMESYERAFLSFILARSYQKLGLTESAEVELRKSYNEQRADIYNYGDDPINLLLLATQWEGSDEPQIARSFWKRAHELSDLESVKSLASERLQGLDRNEQPQSSQWHVYQVDYFPEIDWSFQFSKVGDSYYKVTNTTSFPKSCRSDTGILVPTKEWLSKINQRYQNHYHPLLNLKSWVRLPIGVAYGATTLLAGAAVGIGGCVLFEGSDSGCKAAFEAGMGIADQTDDVVNYTLSPDLRHWDKVPGGIIISKVPLEDEMCYHEQAFTQPRSVIEL